MGRPFFFVECLRLYADKELLFTVHNKLLVTVVCGIKLHDATQNAASVSSRRDT